MRLCCNKYSDWFLIVETGRFGGRIFDGKISQHQKSATEWTRPASGASASAACVQTCWHWRMSHLTVHSGESAGRFLGESAGHQPKQCTIIFGKFLKITIDFYCLISKTKWLVIQWLKEGWNFDANESLVLLHRLHSDSMTSMTLTAETPIFGMPTQLEIPRHLGVTTRKCQNQQAYKLSKTDFPSVFSGWLLIVGRCLWELRVSFAFLPLDASNFKPKTKVRASKLRIRCFFMLIFFQDSTTPCEGKSQVLNTCHWHSDFHPTRNKKRKKLAFIGYASWQDLKPISFYSCRSNVDPMSIQRSSLRISARWPPAKWHGCTAPDAAWSHPSQPQKLTLREPNKLNKHSFNTKRNTKP